VCFIAVVIYNAVAERCSREVRGKAGGEVCGWVGGGGLHGAGALVLDCPCAIAYRVLFFGKSTNDALQRRAFHRRQELL
jgi:hypothetical protein